MSDNSPLPTWRHRQDPAAATMNWDTIARRYVERGGLHRLFGPLRMYGIHEPVVAGANDNAPAATATERKVWPWQVERRHGDWMQTFTGRQFWPMDPRADEVHIEDIAHALSMQCRYAGHSLRFYSVAEHCVHLARYVSEPNRLWALLHDASEAYLVDVPRPVKPFLLGYKEAEARVMAAVCDRFDLSHEMPAEVHKADGRIIADERANMAPCVAEWHATGGPLGVALRYWTPEKAEAEFLWEFERLQNMRVAA